MSSKNDRRAVTLSISLTPELAAEIGSRVESGLYTSASELLREALRLLIRADRIREAQPQRLDGDSPSLARFRDASDLMDFGLELQAEQLRRAAPELSREEALARVQALADSQAAGPGLRIATDRLEQLRIK